MHSSLAEIAHEWHDFYVLVGTASATLVGLMFVAASIGAQVFTERNREALRAFISPTVVHFSATLFICILAAIPSQTWLTLGGLLIAAGAAGIIYSARVLAQLYIGRRFDVDVIDRMFYAAIPALGHVLVLLSGCLLLAQAAWSVDVAAAGVITLLAAGIRNAWDMMLWIVIRTPVPEHAGDPAQ
jgi:hypothetical protein